MTPRQRKPWSKVIEESGMSVRLYERGGTIYRDGWTDDRRDRKSLGHSDRKLAEQQARELARRLAELQHAAQTGALTFGQLVMLYRQHRIPLLATYRQQTVRAHLGILERHIARARVVDDLSQHDVDAYAVARRSGTLESPHKRGQEPGVHDGTIRNELTTLMAMLNWGVFFRIGGRRLLAANPLRGAVIPREKNAKRPLATEDRYQKLLEVADRAEPEGRLRLLLALARHTGRRINALANLRASDVLLSRDQMVTALAAIGAPIAWAEQWPHGALRFSAKFDKRGYESVIPLSGDARAALDVYAERFSPAGSPGPRNSPGCRSSGAARGIPSDGRSPPSVAIFPTSTSWPWRDGVRRASCARATSTRTDRVCSVSSNPPNRARNRAAVAQTRHRRKRSDCPVRPYLGLLTFSAT